MPQVADYSAGIPGAFSLRAAGLSGAVRYIGFPDRLKCTNSWELASFKAAGIGMALVFEDKAGDWKTGEKGGEIFGLKARNHARAVGVPDSRPIYMAVDQDVVRPMDFEIMTRYLKGANKALGGPSGTGVYGEADVIDWARDAGVAEWFWQSTAWSRGRRTEAHLFQLRETVVVNTIDCDLNEVLQADWGQYPLGEAAMLSEADYAEITKRVIQGIKNEVLAGDWRFKGGRNPMDAVLQAVDTGFTNGEKIEELRTALASVYAGVTVVRDRPTVTVDAVAVAAELKAQGVAGVTQEGVETAMRNVLRNGTNG
jgi:hypothetical protein